jgi:tetratricopeptide (TPR) repeat protein
VEIEKALTESNDAARTDRREAIRILEEARSIWGDDPRLLVGLGYQYYRLMDRRTARARLEQAAGAGFDTPELHAYLALVLYYDGDYDHSYQHAQAALNLKNPYPLADQVAGECLYARAKRGELMLSTDDRLTLLQRGLNHLRRSLILDERTWQDDRSNQRAKENIIGMERELEGLKRGIARLEQRTAFRPMA